MSKFVLVLTALCLSGCISLISPAKDLPPRYTLTAAPLTERGADIFATLAVADARAEGALNSSRIAVRTAPNELRYLPEGEWSDRAPLLMSLLVERSFEERGQLLAVADRVSLPISDYTVYIDMSSMHLDRTGTVPEADVVFRVRLESGRGRVLGTQRFAERREVREDTTQMAAQAINDAASVATRDAASWAMELIAKDQVGR